MTTDPTWRKSSYSGGQGNCIEVGNRDGLVLMRDTRQAGPGPMIKVSADAWRAFVARVKTGR
jgi:hypothetical protein